MKGKRSSSGLSAGLWVTSFRSREPPRERTDETTEAVEPYAIEVPVCEGWRPSGEVIEKVVPLYDDLTGGEKGRTRPDEARELMELVRLRTDIGLVMFARC